MPGLEHKVSEQLAQDAARVLAGECCGTCAFAGHLTHVGFAKPAMVVSCEFQGPRWREPDRVLGYWRDRTSYCGHYERRSG